MHPERTWTKSVENTWIHNHSEWMNGYINHITQARGGTYHNDKRWCLLHTLPPTHTHTDHVDIWKQMRIFTLLLMDGQFIVQFPLAAKVIISRCRNTVQSSRLNGEDSQRGNQKKKNGQARECTHNGHIRVSDWPQGRGEVTISEMLDTRVPFYSNTHTHTNESTTN